MLHSISHCMALPSIGLHLSPLDSLSNLAFGSCLHASGHSSLRILTHDQRRHTIGIDTMRLPCPTSQAAQGAMLTALRCHSLGPSEGAKGVPVVTLCLACRTSQTAW